MVARPLPERSRRRVLARAVLKRILDVDDAAIDTDIFRDRADAFFFQRLAGRPVRVAIAGRTVNAGQSDRTGHFQTDVVLDDDDLTAWANPCGTGCRWLPYEGSLAADEEIEAAGADGSRRGGGGGGGGGGRGFERGHLPRGPMRVGSVVALAYVLARPRQPPCTPPAQHGRWEGRHSA
jgi:hypothetical protein